MILLYFIKCYSYILNKSHVHRSKYYGCRLYPKYYTMPEMAAV